MIKHPCIPDDQLPTPVISDTMLDLYAEAYQVRLPLPYSFLSYVSACESIRKRQYAYEYSDYVRFDENY